MSVAWLPQTPAWWFDGSTPPWWARIASTGYAGLIALRRSAYRRGLLRQYHPGVPVIVVGNIVAGGSGKTPLVLAVIERLRAAGYTPGVASRGYGRNDARTPRWVEVGMDAALCGDEPLLIAGISGAKVRVDRDRVAAAQALREVGCDVVVCDDGLQHYRLARDIEIEVQDQRRHYGNGRLLPAGPLREPIERAADCEFRVLNFGAVPHPVACETTEWPMRLKIGVVRPLHTGARLSLEAFRDQRVHAVAGIGEPERFFSMLREAGIGVVPHAFPDHHAYTPEDFSFGSQLHILMTEKDAVKCASFALPSAWVVPISAQLPESFWSALLSRLPHR